MSSGHFAKGFSSIAVAAALVAATGCGWKQPVPQNQPMVADISRAAIDARVVLLRTADDPDAFTRARD